jgi:hypothetical protein
LVTGSRRNSTCRAGHRPIVPDDISPSDEPVPDRRSRPFERRSHIREAVTMRHVFDARILILGFVLALGLLMRPTGVNVEFTGSIPSVESRTAH